MTTDYTSIHKVLHWFDKMLLQVRQFEARKGRPVCLTCTKGCSACCSEMVILTDAEVGLILDGMSEADRAVLKQKVLNWLVKAQAAGVESLVDIKKEHQFKAIEYRRLQIPCPLLTEDGLCSVYDKRPLSCREFMTGGPRIACEDLNLREKQQFLTIVELFQAARNNLLEATTRMGVAEIRVSHLGFLLGVELGLIEEDKV